MLLVAMTKCAGEGEELLFYDAALFTAPSPSSYAAV